LRHTPVWKKKYSSPHAKKNSKQKFYRLWRGPLFPKKGWGGEDGTNGTCDGKGKDEDGKRGLMFCKRGQSQ